MSSVGIIAEYNPFHNGHLYQIKKIKEKYPTATIIIAMSGNFTQRGTPAIIDKWERAKLAIENPANLIDILLIFVKKDVPNHLVVLLMNCGYCTVLSNTKLGKKSLCFFKIVGRFAVLHGPLVTENFL